MHTKKPKPVDWSLSLVSTSVTSFRAGISNTIFSRFLLCSSSYLRLCCDPIVDVGPNYYDLSRHTERMHPKTARGMCNLALRSFTSCQVAGLVFGVYSVARPSRVGADTLSHRLLGHEAGASPNTGPRKRPLPAFSTASRGHVVRLRQAGHNRRPRDRPEPNSGLWGGRSGQLGGRHSEDASNVTPGPIRKAGRNETSLRDYPLLPNKSLLPAELREVQYIVTRAKTGPWSPRCGSSAPSVGESWTRTDGGGCLGSARGQDCGVCSEIEHKFPM